MSYLLLLIALAIILVSAELFTNGVEWFGRRYELGEGAAGSVLAALGTALPETLVPIIAIVFRGGCRRRHRRRRHPGGAVHAGEPGDGRHGRGGRHLRVTRPP